jgi:hypothetical protein
MKNRQLAGRVDGPVKPTPKIGTKQAINRATQLRNKAKQLSKQAESMMGGGRKDGAIVNVSLNSGARRSAMNKGVKGSRLAAQAEALNSKADRVLDRAIASRKKAEKEAAKSKTKQRSAESLRISRAKQVKKRRSINITNPAGRREDASAIMAANAARTQKRALEFYKQKGRAPKAPIPAPKPPTRTKGSKASLPRTPGTVAKPKGLKAGVLASKGKRVESLRNATKSAPSTPVAKQKTIMIKNQKPAMTTTLAPRASKKQRPASRPMSKPEYGIIADYVSGVRASRKSLKTATSQAAKASAEFEYKLAKKALKNRIKRERGLRQGLKPMSFFKSITAMK